MLTDKKIQNAKAKKKPYKLADRDALYLYVSPTGTKSWRFDYRYGTNEQGKPRRFTHTYDTYPDLSLGEARAKHAEARQALSRGENPAILRQREKAKTAVGNSFKSLGEDWYADEVKPKSESWRDAARRYLDLAYTHIGSHPIKDVTDAEMLAMLREIQKKRGPHIAATVRKVCALAFDYGIGNLRATSNPARNLRKLIAYPKAKNHPHLSLKELPAFIKAVQECSSDAKAKLATKILLLTFVRKTELRAATWDELDLDAGLWEIPGKRMKNGVPHLVPLAPQAIEAFKELKKLANGSDYILPKMGDQNRYMGENTINLAFERAGYAGRFTPHGVRSTASTALNAAGFRADLIERQLSHVERDEIRRIYNRADYLQERTEMMTWWADMLDSLCSGEKVIPFRGKAA